ncbi:MAG: dual specificity protein phosphatase family protein [Actinomycetota bacterium]|nr:dual specificity protein phosphatase family protein [Actinomycetota bacterium]MDQ3679722.1 dual specificity protein phosphatase family protein [Actinomycetota bacterium]
MRAVALPRSAGLARIPRRGLSIGRIGRIGGLVTAFFLVPNVGIALAHRLARKDAPTPPRRLPIKNFAEVDHGLWRGAAPTEEAYRILAANGVTTVVDLRAEESVEAHDAVRNRLGIARMHLPLRDGRAPTRDQVQQFLTAVNQSRGRVYTHCGAGVGRTGTMAAAYLVATGQATGRQAVGRNLSVGPPSLEQLAFSAGLDGRDFRRPPAPVVALSRALDGPRRIWARITSQLHR